MTDATGPADDPVRARRAHIARIASSAQRIGYLLYGLAMVMFFIGFFAGFTGAVVTVIVIALAIGSALLAPAIVTGYAVKAAEREDLELGR